MEYRTRVSSKGQIVIPKEIRDKLGYREGIEVVLRPVDDTKLIIERAPKLTELFGFLGEARISSVLVKKREREVKAEKERERELALGR